jgi:hypothetical protein
VHRHPPRDGAGAISRCRRAGARRAGWQRPSRRPARRGHAQWLRWSASASATMSARRSRSSKLRALEVSLAIPRRTARAGRALACPRCCSAPRIVEATDAVHDCEPFGSGLHHHGVPYKTSPTASPLANRGKGQPRAFAVHPFTRSGARLSFRAPQPITAGCWSSTATNAAESTGHGSPLRCWSTAGPAAPAEARRWAASRGSSITCSAPRSSRRRR